MNLNSMEVIPVIMIIGGGVLYHVCQKATPVGLNPFLALGISSGLASLGCLGLFVGRQGLATPELHTYRAASWFEREEEGEFPD